MDNIINIEDEAVRAGRAEGIRRGRADGWLEARSLGVEEGFKIGQELGWFTGACQVIRDTARKSPVIAPKAAQLLADTETLLAAYPKGSTQDPALQDAMEEIRAKFKALAAQLGLYAQFFPRGNTETLEF